MKGFAPAPANAKEQVALRFFDSWGRGSTTVRLFQVPPRSSTIFQSFASLRNTSVLCSFDE